MLWDPNLPRILRLAGSVGPNQKYKCTLTATQTHTKICLDTTYLCFAKFGWIMNTAVGPN